MLNMVATGSMRILKKLDSGVDVNGNPWAHFAAISCEETVEAAKQNDFYILKTFGPTVDYIERNLTTPRRAFISGELKLEKYTKGIPIKKELKIGEEKYEVLFSPIVENQRACLYVSVCDFLDKKIKKKAKLKPATVNDVVAITKK